MKCATPTATAMLMIEPTATDALPAKADTAHAAQPAHLVEYRAHRDPRSSHQQIVTFVKDNGHGPVLDVGTATGLIGRMLLDTGLAVDGIEISDERAEIARPFYRQLHVTRAELAPLRDDTYAVVLCGDVLEHTLEPVEVLRHLKKAATADAAFVVSLPNVAHVAVRTLLLFGQFPKMDKGILDRTHLHFFTRRTAAAMLREAGFEIQSARATGFPIDEIWKSGERSPIYKILMKLQHLALAVAPSLFGWQWVFVARRSAADRREHLANAGA